MEIDTKKVNANEVHIIITDDQPIMLRGLITGLAHWIKIQVDNVGMKPEDFKINEADKVDILEIHD